LRKFLTFEIRNLRKEARAMKVSADALRRYLAEELEAIGLSDEKILAILGKLFPERREPTRRRAKLVLSQKLPDETVAQFRRELELRAAERKLLRREREFSHLVWFVGGTKVVATVRQGEEVTIWNLRKTVARRRPRTNRLIFQRIPSVRVRTYEIERVVIGSPNRDEMVLTFPSRASSGVRLTPDLLKERPRTAMIRVYHRSGLEECEVDIEDWRDVVRSIPSFCRRCIRVEISTDGERWFDAYEILPERR
jgi:hypothetical protein